METNALTVYVRDSSTVEKANALVKLGFSNVEYRDFGEIYSRYVDDAGTDKKLHPAYRGADGRVTRARLFRDWLLSVYEVLKSPAASERSTMYYLRRRRPRVKDGLLSSDGVVFETRTAQEFKAMTSRVFLSVFPGFSGSADVKEMYETLTVSITELLDKMPDRWLYAGGGLAFDRGDSEDSDAKTELVDLTKRYVLENGELDSEKGPLPRIFYRLFDTNPVATQGDNDIVVVPEPDARMAERLMSAYNTTLKNLEKGERVERIPEIDEWCCGFYDRYVDIIHMASARLKKHDFGVYLLAGVGRNGKSSCIDLMASLYGTNNTCRVHLDKLGDRHNLQNFKRALVNLPDEQKPSSDENNKPKVMDGDASMAFRIAANHGAMNMDVMGSNNSDVLYYSFVTTAPINSVPKFPSDVQKACIDRCRIIEFQGDFSDSDLLDKKWGKVHFTPDFMMRFAGQVLAFANYYSAHPWKMTEMMTLARTKQYEDTASDVTFMKRWEKIYCGYDSYKTVKAEYDNYCTLFDIEPVTFNKHSILLVPYSRRTTREVPLKGTVHVRTNPALEKKCKGRVMMGCSVEKFIDSRTGENLNLTKGKALEDFHKEGGSIIFELEDRGYFDQNDKEQMRLPGIKGGE